MSSLYIKEQFIEEYKNLFIKNRLQLPKKLQLHYRYRGIPIPGNTITEVLPSNFPSMR